MLDVDLFNPAYTMQAGQENGKNILWEFLGKYFLGICVVSSFWIDVLHFSAGSFSLQGANVLIASVLGCKHKATYVYLPCIKFH